MTQEAAANSAKADKLRVLITGANGLIGNLVYARLAEQPAAYEVYGLVRRKKPSRRSAPSFRPIPDQALRVADLADWTAVRRVVQGIDVIVHLAAEADAKAGWPRILHNNIVGAYNIFEVARRSGVQRIVFASSNQVVLGAGSEAPYDLLLAGRFTEIDPAAIKPIDHQQPTRPLSLYASSKVFGESLAYTYSQVHGLSCLCLRIGWVTPDDRLPPSNNARSLWCSQRDVVQLVERAVNAPSSLRFDIFFGHSDNLYNIVDIQHARDVLGYVPQDRAEDL